MKKIFVTLICSLMSTNLSGIALAQNAQGEGPRPVVSAKPIPLDWRSVNWQSLDFNRRAVPGGAALYTLKSPSARKFKIDIVFPTTVYSIKQSDRVALGAAVDLVLQGGVGKRNYDEVTNYLQEQGISLVTFLNDQYFQISVDGLAEDFNKAYAVLEDLIFRPRFDADAITYWKQQKSDEFDSLLDASTLQKQYQFVSQEMSKALFGNDHYLGSALERRSKNAIKSVQYADVKRIHKDLINRAGLITLLSGTFTEKHETAMLKLMERVPRKNPKPTLWLAERGNVPTQKKVKVVFIQKPDMTQAAILFRYMYPHAGELNAIEESALEIAQEVYSASGGVVGNDRFSKAMRADSGISYSAYSVYDSRYLDPNTNVGLWTMTYQSPNERITESIRLAKKTWEDFRAQGVTEEELERARTTRMNMILAREETIFDKSRYILNMLLRDKVPSAIPLESKLVHLESHTDIKSVNKLLKDLVNSEAVPAIVVMGNSSQETVNALKADAGYEVVKVLEYRDLVNSLVKE